jgi:exopolysaccharide biosynthesis glucuronosyltransferase PssE
MLGSDPVIFVSVGSMLPFDRLVKAADDWAAAHPSKPVFIQIGEGSYEPRHAPWVRIMPHGEYRRRLEACDLFVAHVGMGSILQGLEVRKQMLLLPRLAAQREHTTDHQLHTAARFKDTPGLMIVDDVEALQANMTRLLKSPMKASQGIPRFASDTFTDRVADFLAGRQPSSVNG